MITTSGEPRTYILHAIRVKGFANDDSIAEATNLQPDVIAAVLREAQAGQLVSRVQGRISGWRLTASGRDDHRRRLDEELERTGAEAAIQAAYERFLPLNHPFKELCTAWQLNGQPNSCIDELVEFHRTGDPVAEALGLALPRFGPYRGRFAAALERLRQGDASAFTTPLAGSYHDVWMELHQDLLLTLNRQRSSSDGH